MSHPLRLHIVIGLFIAICALGMLAASDMRRVQRTEFLSNFAGNDTLAIDPASPTGYVGGLRKVIVLERGGRSYRWMAQTQQMLSDGGWFGARVDYDHAPTEKNARATSPYRWWLALVAGVHHFFSGHSIGVSVEWSGQWADPLWHLILIVGSTWLVAWRFGAWAGTLVAAGLAGLFPFSGVFAGGLADDRGLLLGCVFGGVLLLQVGLAKEGDVRTSERRPAQWFYAAGVVGGIGLWMDAAGQWPILIGIAAGGMLAGWLVRDAAAALSGALWRGWALGGATAVLIVCAAEGFSRQAGSLQVSAILPLLGLAWLGVGEILAWGMARSRGSQATGTRFARARLMLGLGAVVAVPLTALVTRTGGLIGEGALMRQLTNLGGGISAHGSLAWLLGEGVTRWTVASVLPLALLAPAIWLLWREPTGNPRRVALAVGLGPVIVGMALAVFQLRWWATIDAALLAVLVVGTGVYGRDVIRPAARWLWAGCFVAALVPGMVCLFPPTAANDDSLSEGEVETLVERDLAYWLARRTGKTETVVLAPPAMTTSLIFHGGLRGLATPYPENNEELSAAVRIARAPSADEAQALMTRRKVTHILIPSWDGFLADCARFGVADNETTLMELLHRWQPPRWLRPIPYQLPRIAGFERQSVAIFEVVELQDNVTAISRLAEYFAEMGQLDHAAAAAKTLAKVFPDDAGALLARAEVAMACGDDADFGAVLALLERRLTDGADRTWSWDRRINLALVLATGKHHDAARNQLRRCVAEIDETRLRSLTMVGLYRLHLLCKRFGQEIRDPELRELARTLLPVEMKAPL